jgi:hypothetical protein
MIQPIAWMQLVWHRNGTHSQSLHFREPGVADLKEGDTFFNQPLIAQPADSEWIADLKKGANAFQDDAQLYLHQR